MSESVNRLKVVMPLAASGESGKYPEKFRELGVDFEARLCADDDAFIALAADADIIITVGSIRPVPRKIIDNLRKCRLICNTQIGYDSIDTAAAAEKGILVTNVPDYCTEEVSDHAMALVLACVRKVVQLNDAAKRGEWGLSARGEKIQQNIWPRMSRMQGQTLGLLGLGRVSRAIVPKAKGFQLRVIACDPYVTPETAQQLGVELVDWQTLLRQSDFLTVHAALTPETRHILNAEAFQEMKPTAFLINAARGGLIDETALYRALKGGELAMAALDVADPEPPDPGNPLLGMENVIFTAHSAFFSPDSEAERWHRPVLEVARLLRGEWPKAVVNPGARERYVARWGEMKEPVR